MRVLVIEDDRKISDYLTKGLIENGYNVDAVYDGEDGLTFATANNYDLMVIDIMLPKLDGLELISSIRKKNISTPVLILSAKHSVDDRVIGLQRGGDDYLVKPFAFSELLARVQALLRRSVKTPDATTLSLYGISLDMLSREVKRDNKKIELHIKEFSLLEYFMRNPGRVLSKTLILEKIWNYQFDPQTNVVDVLVCRLRNKLDKGFKPKTIQTIRGIGYVFKEH